MPEFVNGKMFHQTKQKERFCLWNQEQLNVIKGFFNISGLDLNQMGLCNGIVVQNVISVANDA
jgi:hypothetical protein